MGSFLLCIYFWGEIDLSDEWNSTELEKELVEFHLRDERMRMQSFINTAYDDLNSTLIRNYAPPGIGKSHLLTDIIRRHPEEDFVVVIPDHLMATGIGDLEDMLNQRRVTWTHIYGKTQEHPTEGRFCLRDQGQEYYTGCSFDFEMENYQNIYTKYGDSYDYDWDDCIAKCAFRRNCPYKRQFRNLEDYQVIICVFEHARMFANRVLVFDESFEQKLLTTITISTKEIERYHISITTPTYFTSNKHVFTFFDDVNLLFPVRIQNQRDYFVARFFDDVEYINGYVTNDDRICLFGRKVNYIPEYTRLYFNCATTSVRLMENITNTETLGFFDPDMVGWSIYRSDEYDNTKLSNPILKFKRNFSKQYANKLLPMAIKYFKMFGDNILIVTKMTMEERFEKQFPNTNFVHYNAGRGFNSMDREGGYDALILYGRYGFNPLTKEMFRRIGFSDDLISDMEESEMLQCLHRGRPILHPKMPIILMSDKDLFPDITPVSVNLFQLFYDHYDIDFEQPIKEIAKKLGVVRSQRAIEFRRFVEFIRKHIYRMYDREDDYTYSDIDILNS